MDEPQRLSNVSVLQSRQPALRIIRKVNDVLADDLNEHQLSKLGKQALAAGAAAFGLFGGEAKHVRKPSPSGGRNLADEHFGAKLPEAD